MSTSESSILSSAEAYARQGGEPLGIGEIVKVKLNMRFVSGGGGCLVSTLSLKREALQMASLKSKRRKYDEAEKKKILAVAHEHGVTEAARRANMTSGFEHVNGRQIRRWRVHLEGPSKKKAGRKGTPDAFNAAVLSELVFASVEDIDNKQRLK